MNALAKAKDSPPEDGQPGALVCGNGFQQKVDNWIDLLFPIATTLLCVDNQKAAYGLMTLWLGCRLALNSRFERLNWILLGLLLVNAGTIALDRDLKPSSPSDLLIIALAFAAGLNRSIRQWQRSLQLIIPSVLPLLILAVVQQPRGADVLSLPGFNVNRLAFLLGILMIASWSLARAGTSMAMRLGGLSLALACIPLEILTRSRAALLAPLLAIVLGFAAESIAALSRSPKRQRRALIALISTMVIMAGSAYQWYGRGSASHEDIASDSMRFPTAYCWAQQAFKNPISMAYGQGFNKSVQSRCDGDNIPILMEVSPPNPRGLPHAHNLYAQLLGETGLSGFAVALAATLWVGKALLQKLRTSNNEPEEKLLGTYLSGLVIYLFLNSMFTSFQISLMPNQVLVGYSLAALSSGAVLVGSRSKTTSRAS